MPRTKSPLETKERLTQKALELFAVKGYDPVTVDEIVKAAEVTKGAFYHHYRSKEDCLAELHLAYINFANERFLEIVGRPKSADQTIRDLMTEMFRQVRDYRPQVVVLWDTRRSLPEDVALVAEEKKAEIRHLFVRAIRRGQSEGVFDRSQDPHAAALAIFGMCIWAYNWYDAKGPQSAESLARSFADLVVVGLQHPGSSLPPDEASLPA
jgi:AcrR family transcriptional regulator